MRKVTLTPGKLSQMGTGGSRTVLHTEITPDKHQLLQNQRKSIQRLSVNPRTTRRDALQWEAKEQQYREQIGRLKEQRTRLMNKIEEMENKQSSVKILDYEMYIVELDQKMKEQKQQFLKKYKTLEDKLKGLAKEEEEKYAEVAANSQRYRTGLDCSIRGIIETFSCFLRLRNDESDLGAVQKQFIKLYSIVQTFIEQFDIQSSLEQAMQQEQSYHRSSVMTFPANSVFKQTFNKEMFQTEVSTTKSQRSFQHSNLVEGNSYRVKKCYDCDGGGHLRLRQGEEVKLLKRNGNGMWIGESGNGQNIGFFPECILL